jgi:hypothetical protein
MSRSSSSSGLQRGRLPLPQRRNSFGSTAILPNGQFPISRRRDQSFALFSADTNSAASVIGFFSARDRNMNADACGLSGAGESFRFRHETDMAQCPT